MKSLCIVDDEKPVLEGLKTCLDWESYGINIGGSFTDPRAALKSMKDRDYDILLTDVCMEGMSGLELIEKAKELNDRISVVVISAWDNFSYVKRALKQGALNYLLKPLDVEELEETVQTVLDKSKETPSANAVEDRNMLAFRNTILDRWLRNRINEYELLERADMLQIDLNRDSYTCCLIRIENPGQTFDTCSQVLDLIGSDGAGTPSSYYFVQKTNLIAGIVLDERKDGLGLENLLKSLSGRAEGRGIRISCAIGSVVNDFMLLHRSYDAAGILMNLHELNHQVFNYRDFIGVAEHYELRESLEKMEESVRMGSFHDARDSFGEFLCRAEKRREGISTTVGLFLAAWIFRIIGNSMSLAELPDNIRRYIPLIGKSDSPRRDLEDLFQECASLISTHTESYHPLVRITLQGIFQESNREMSLKTAAGKLGVNAAYLGQLFHNQTGKYFNAYLTEVRLEKARNLIVNSDLSVSEIAYRTGFSSTSYFNRIFKNAYAVPPSEYRYQKKAGEDSR